VFRLPLTDVLSSSAGAQWFKWTYSGGGKSAYSYTHFLLVYPCLQQQRATSPATVVNDNSTWTCTCLMYSTVPGRPPEAPLKCSPNQEKSCESTSLFLVACQAYTKHLGCSQAVPRPLRLQQAELPSDVA
jgi:hypothetical protein